MYENLHQFMLSTFHQDWKLDAADERSNVRYYVSTAPRARCVTVLTELDELLADDISEGRLRKYITRDFGANVVPPKGGPNRWHTWLHMIRDYLEREMTER